MSKPSRVLLVMDRAARAGTERHVLWLAEGLKRRGWNVALAVSDDGPLIPSFRRLDVAVHVIPRRRGVVSYVLRLGRLARRLRADILHAHSGRVAALAGRLARIPLVIETRHGLGPPGESGDLSRMRREARFCRLAHRNITVASCDRERLVAAGLAPERVVSIPNGIPGSGEGESRAGPSPAITAKVRLGFLGRLTEQKNPLFLIDIARQLEERAAGRWELLIAGDGPLRGSLIDGLSEQVAEGTVVWWGEVDGPERLLERSDLLLMPSRWEGQPLTALEAMQAGVVVLARGIAGMEELLGGDPPAGLLLGEDAASWADAAISYLTDRVPFDAMAAEARRRIASRHSLDRMLDSVEALYRETFAVRGGRW